MRPTLAGLDARDSVLSNSVFGRNLFLFARIENDRSRLSFGELSRRRAFASIASAVQNAVSLIVGGCVPSKVREFVVERIPIVVATLVTRWRLADEGEQHQSTRLHDHRLVFSPESQKGPVSIAVGRPLLESAGSHIANLSVFRDLVKPLEPNDRFPCVFHAHDYPTLRHGQ